MSLIDAPAGAANPTESTLLRAEEAYLSERASQNATELRASRAELGQVRDNVLAAIAQNTAAEQEGAAAAAFGESAARSRAPPVCSPVCVRLRCWPLTSSPRAATDRVDESLAAREKELQAKMSDLASDVQASREQLPARSKQVQEDYLAAARPSADDVEPPAVAEGAQLPGQEATQELKGRIEDTSARLIAVSDSLANQATGAKETLAVVKEYMGKRTAGATAGGASQAKQHKSAGFRGVVN